MNAPGLPPVRLAVFDCDGTLVDGQAEICTTMAEAFATLGMVAPARADILRTVGLSLPMAMRRLAPQAEAEAHAALVEQYKTAYRAAREAGRIAEPLFEGIAPLLDALRADGWDLGVATGKSDRGLAHCLAVHGLSDHFVTLQTADRHPSKPHPAMLMAALDACLARPEHSVMIGDTTFDMAMAASAGVRAIGVSWGYHRPDELMAAGAQAVAETPEQLREILG
ncbi:MAG TPA: HAD-IA family hydrolase [Novosphingobium sp.]|nr:HAD-IA family hydrolase [Novosphingobium sp.]